MSDVFRVHGSSFDPGEVSRLSQAFDDAWRQVGHRYEGAAAEAAKLRLGQVIMLLSGPYGLNVDLITREALQILEKDRGVHARWRSGGQT